MHSPWRQEARPEAAWGARASHNATKQVDMQPSSSAANLIDVSSRELSCKQMRTDRQAQAFKVCLAPGGPSRDRLGHLGGPFRGRLKRLEVCPEAVLGWPPRAVLSARRTVRRPSLAPGRPDGREAKRQGGQAAGRPGGREARQSGGPAAKLPRRAAATNPNWTTFV